MSTAVEYKNGWLLDENRSQLDIHAYSTDAGLVLDLAVITLYDGEELRREVQFSEREVRLLRALFTHVLDLAAAARSEVAQ
jgi:hypothetical protein